MDNIEIGEATIKDYEKIKRVYKDSFGEDEKIINNLVKELLEDQSGKPFISLLASFKGEPLGHILFTKANIDNNKNNISTYILAPLGVVKKYQNKGVGKALIMKGLEKLKEINAQLIFVLGYPTYYNKYGFINNAIEKIGYEPTFPIPKKNYDAWMYINLTSIDEIKKNPGRVICAKSMDKKEYWME